MYNELTKLIINEIEIRKDSAKDVSNKVRDLLRIYNMLIPNKNKNKKHSAMGIFIQNEELFLEFMEIIRKYNNVLYDELHELMDELYEIGEERYNLTVLEPGIIQLDFTNNNEKELMELERKENLVIKKSKELIDYAGDYIIELFERLQSEKESKKEKIKIYESALKTLTKKRTLSSKEIKAITELIESREIDKNKYYNLLNEYIKKKNEESAKKKEEKTSSKEDEKIEQKVYVDSETIIAYEKEEPLETLISNYITSIYALQSEEKSLKEFLDAISYNEDFEDILNKIIIIISENGNTNLSEFLKAYQKELTKEEDIIEDEKEGITLLYYGFLQGKETILKDIEDIQSTEDYKDIQRAFEMIKNNGAKGYRRNIVRIRKVFKLRVNNIRVTFKRISKNVYIVLGVYRKKDTHGAKIIFSTERRNNHLLRYEKQVVEAIKMNKLWDLYLEKNSETEENIFNLLKEHIYMV